MHIHRDMPFLKVQGELESNLGFARPSESGQHTDRGHIRTRWPVAEMRLLHCLENIVTSDECRHYRRPWPQRDLHSRDRVYERVREWFKEILDTHLTP
jgi:hypothetical protein